MKGYTHVPIVATGGKQYKVAKNVISASEKAMRSLAIR